MHAKIYRYFARALAAFFFAASAGAASAAPNLTLATTTSTENSGLLGFLLPLYEAKCQCKVKVIAVGTGKALELGKNGDVDVVLVHARPAEDKFVAAGHGVNRRDVMYNDFIIVGPPSDPAGVKGMRDVLAALRKIHDSGAKFISRGDNSGTDQMEKAYWKTLSIVPEGKSYISAGVGMGQVLSMASELKAYTLTDRATYGAYRARTGLEISVQGDPKMFNPYGVIAVNPQRWPAVNYRGAMDFIEWLTSAEGQKHIARYKVSGEQLFFPSAK